MRKFKRGYKFIPQGSMREWEVVNYDDTDDLYICKCKSMGNLITYFEEKEIRNGKLNNNPTD